MKKYFVVMLSFIFLTSFILQGCGLPNQPYLKKDASETSLLKVYHTETPNHRVFSKAGMISAIVISAVLLGGVGAGMGYVIHQGTTIQSSNPEIPDYGKLVKDKFVERAPKEIPNWPPMTVEDKSINKESSGDKNCYALEIAVNDIVIEKTSGLTIETTVTMKDKENNVIWKKGYIYDAYKFSRWKSYDSLKADNFKLLKEEFVFATDQTVTDFITHFKNSLSSTERQG